MQAIRSTRSVCEKMNPIQNFARRCAQWALLATTVILASSQVAHATSGDVLDLDGLYSIPPASCDTVRAITTTDLDIIIPCSADARADGVRVCDIVSASNVNIGLAIGQCQDSFPIPLSPPEPGTDLESNVSIVATASGSDIAYVPGAPGTTDKDVICNSYADGTNRCIEVSPGTCPFGGCPSCGIKAFSDTCDEVQSQLQTAVTSTPPDLSHYLALDVESTGTANYLAVGVCTGFKWTCSDPSVAGPLAATLYDELLFSTTQTPVCITMNRKRICR